MNRMNLFLVLLTGLLLFSTSVCGAWMLAQESVTQGNILFHMQVGAGTVLLTILMMIQLLRKS